MEGWVGPQRRRKKNARSEESVSSENLNVNNKRRSLIMMYRKVDEITAIYILENFKASRWVAVKPSPIASRTRTKINIK